MQVRGQEPLGQAGANSMTYLKQFSKLAILGLLGLLVIYIATWALVLAVYLAAFVFAGWVLMQLAERFKPEPTARTTVQRATKRTKK